jgi:hypothetical protein
MTAHEKGQERKKQIPPAHIAVRDDSDKEESGSRRGRVSEVLGEFLDGGGEVGFGGLAVGEGGAEAGMEFAGAGAADDFGEVSGVDAAAGENDDAIGGSGDEIGEGRDALSGGTFPAGGEDASGAGFDDGFEGFGEIGRFIEGAMESDGKWVGDFDERVGLFDVHRVVVMEDAENEAVHFAGFGDFDVAAHLGEFGVGISEAAAARTNHGEDGNFDRGAGFAHEFGAGRDAADAQVIAEFDAIGATAFGGDGGGEGFDRDFEEWGHVVNGLVWDMGSIEDGPLQKAGPTTAFRIEKRKKKQFPNPAKNAGVGMTSVVAFGGVGMTEFG